jgi:sialate O-acetylesterase
MRKQFKLFIASFLVLSFSFNQLEAKILLPSVFSSNMVLQQKAKVNIWGKAAPGKVVMLSCSWTKKGYSIKANDDGSFTFKVSTPGFGGPYSIVISDGEAIKLDNVMIGEVWLCSGQSNMEMPLGGWGKIKNYEQEIAAANYPSIRLLQVDHVTANIPLDNAKVSNGGWTECTPQYVAEFSSVAYFYAREIYKKTGIPIGLIHTSWGGTPAEAWTSARMLKTMPDFKEAVTQIENTGTQDAQKKYEEDSRKWIELVNAKDAGSSNGEAQWQRPIAIDASWQNMKLPTVWENAALPDFDGIVWFRKNIQLSKEQAGKDIQLSLGEIDDNETTWFNGEKVGATEGYDRPRNYTIKSSLVKEGENEIVVRVFDGGGGGGLYGNANSMKLTMANGEVIPLAGDWLYKVGVNFKDAPAKPMEVSGSGRPSVLFNAMIHPFIPFTIKGVIWYQGEANVGRADQYKKLFPNLISDWRNHWNQGNFPFYFVQLANYLQVATKPEESAWAALREAQFQTLSLPNTAMATTIDIGEAGDIHPKNKQEVGHRLALIALAKTYGQKNDFSGPEYSGYKVMGNQVQIQFKYAGADLKTRDNSTLKGFEIAGKDNVFYPATAFIKGSTVIVNSSQVVAPVAVRYDWANNPIGNLTNHSGLPAVPFRTGE